MRRLWVVVFAACGSNAAKPAPVTKAEPPAPKPEPAPACIKSQDEETVAITPAVADGTRVKYCIGGNVDQCFSLDTANGNFEKLSERPKTDELANAHVETTTPEIKVCQPTAGSQANDNCKTLTPKVLPNMAQMRAATHMPARATPKCGTSPT